MTDAADPRIVIQKNGPYRVTGGVPLSKQVIETDAEGQSREWRAGQTYEVTTAYDLCRCGQSDGKPFCDGTHARVHFNGSETATRQPYLEQAEEFDGPGMVLTDAEGLCAFARFCDPDGRVWNVIEETDDPAKQEIVKHEAGHCPGGRLVAWTKEPREALEPEFDPSLGLIEDPHLGVSGPIWARGRIPVESANGTTYEIRNRVALCRCGSSSNKPFCDGSHASIQFSDER